MQIYQSQPLCKPIKETPLKKPWAEHHKQANKITPNTIQMLSRDEEVPMKILAFLSIHCQFGTKGRQAQHTAKEL